MAASHRRRVLFASAAVLAILAGAAWGYLPWDPLQRAPRHCEHGAISAIGPVTLEADGSLSGNTTASYECLEP